MKKLGIGLVAGLALVVGIFGLPPFTGGPDRNEDLANGYSQYETGVWRQPNGIYQVNALTRMPNVSAEMVEWWFADYMQTSEHYIRWHPTAHLWMDWENKQPGTVIGASHLVHEYIGDELSKLRIQFVPHQEILGDIEMNEGDTVACGRVGLLEQPMNVGRLCHYVRNTEFGAEMRSRFWLGVVSKRDGNEQVGSIQGLLGNTYLARMALLREKGANDLMIHAMEEMGTLADFLPELYAAETAK